jgi:UDP-N-acetylmuramyl pentapeptide synthase
MPIPLIQKRVSKIIPWKKTMEPIERNDGLLLVDDTFNSSPGATAAAIRYMNIFEKKKVLVLQPFIELGVNAVRDHEMIGEKIGYACTHLFLTNDNYYDCIVRGLKRSGKNCTVQIAQPQEIIAYVEDELKKDDVVVFEGKEAGISLHRLSQTLNKPIL